MVERHNDKHRVVKDLSGEPLRLALVKKEEYEDKEYDLYTICKVLKRDEEYEYIPLYSETFTPQQYAAFYDNATYYIAVTEE